MAALPESEKTAWLLRLASGQETHVRAELLKSFRTSRGQGGLPPGTSRTVAQIMEACQQHAEARRRREAERAARERLRREQEAEAARERHLASLAKREPDAWRQVDALIATKRPRDRDAGPGVRSYVSGNADWSKKGGQALLMRKAFLSFRRRMSRLAGLSRSTKRMPLR